VGLSGKNMQKKNDEFLWRKRSMDENKRKALEYVGSIAQRHDEIMTNRRTNKTRN